MKGILPLILVFQLFFISCRSDTKPLLPDIGGKPGDVAVVISKADWDGAIGEEYRKIFNRPFEMLPQYEPIYDLKNIPYDAFNELFQRHRNVIFTEISPRYGKPRMLVENDRYAKSQILIHLQAPDDDSFVKLLYASQYKILEYLEQTERKRLLYLHEKIRDEKIQARILKKHIVILTIPQGYSIVRDSTDFTWINQEIGSIIQGIVIYHYPFRDSSDFAFRRLITVRDRFMKKYMPGEVEGMYMTTEKEFEPQYSEYLFKGKIHVAEMRGLWKTEKGISMGGPFISISTVDEKNNRVITVEGFVYAAGYDKREYMRQMEAILYTMKFPETVTSDE